MSTPTDDGDRSKLISDALELALDVSRQGADNLSEFLGGITNEASAIADRAGAQMQQLPTQELAERGGRLANDALSVALDVALIAKRQMENDAAARERNLAALSELVSFFGSAFIDTTNRAVGTAAQQPASARARHVTVKLKVGATETSSAWVVNRGTSTVTDAAVRVLRSENPQVRIEFAPELLTIGPRRRSRIEITATAEGVPPGSFEDALLVVEGVGSIVVRTIVENPADSSATTTS